MSMAQPTSGGMGVRIVRRDDASGASVGLVPAQEVVAHSCRPDRCRRFRRPPQRDVARRDKGPTVDANSGAPWRCCIRREKRARRLVARLRVLCGPRDALAESIGDRRSTRPRDDEVGPVDGLPAVCGGLGTGAASTRAAAPLRERIAAHERAGEIRTRPQRGQRLRRGVVDHLDATSALRPTHSSNARHAAAAASTCATSARWRSSQHAAARSRAHA